MRRLKSSPSCTPNRIHHWPLLLALTFTRCHHQSQSSPSLSLPLSSPEPYFSLLTTGYLTVLLATQVKGPQQLLVDYRTGYLITHDAGDAELETCQNNKAGRL
jgi:hypothetical protein